MSNFDIFFYRLQSRHKMYINEVRMYSEDFGTSLRGAATDIRAYLNKYPYHVDNYHLIVTMRSDYKRDQSWSDTMLRRLIHLNRALLGAHIYMNSRERTQKALSLIMLYDADFSADLPTLDYYITGARLTDDCRLLLDELRVPQPYSLDGIAASIEAYRLTPDHDEYAADLLEDFVRRQRLVSSDIDTLENISQAYIENGDSMSADVTPTALIGHLAQYMKSSFPSYQVFEVLIDRNDQRESILSLLRIVDFINRPTETAPEDTKRLVECVRENWNGVMNDRDIERRYAKMLFVYRKNISDLSTDLENASPHATGSKSLPAVDIPTDSDIKPDGDGIKMADARGRFETAKTMLQRFASHISARTAAAEWKELYESIKDIIWDMDTRLQKYARALSQRYSDILELRNKEYTSYHNSSFHVTATTAREIEDLDAAREDIFVKMKNPKMNSSLSFQDRLNMENALEEENLNIKFYIKCLVNVNILNLFILILGCGIPFFLHYTVLQPYVYGAAETLALYLGYIGAAFLLMLFSWNLPRRYFIRKIKKSLQNLAECSDKYIKAYFEKADDFLHYINLLNSLDYITRCHQLRSEVYRGHGRLTKGLLWQKVQAKRHIEKLQYFQGLIDLCDPADPELIRQVNIVTDTGVDSVVDTIDNPVYWPQR